MDVLIKLLMWPPLHIVLCMSPMAYVVLGKHLHAVMSDRFKLFVKGSWPFALILALGVSAIHPLSFAMGAAIMSPYLQWAAVHALYRRFERKHSRAPRTMEEYSLADVAIKDRLFNVSTSIIVMGLPALVVILLIWYLRISIST